MKTKLGMHWLRYHQDGRDLEHIERMQYRSIKPFQWMWNNRDFCRNLLAVLPRDAYITARDHPLSEQKDDMWHNPIGTGERHANEWASKVANGEYHLPIDRTFFLGINEPDATNGDRNAIDLYTEAFLRRLQRHGLRGGAFNFSTGHPRTKDGTAHTKADYTVFERSHRAIVDGHHIALAHIYGTGAVPLAPGHYDRLDACDWQDVEWIIGEAGVDEHVIGGGEHAGFHEHFNGRLGDYCTWLDAFIIGINDPRIHSYQVFSYDFSHPWGSFDVRAIREAMERYDWQHPRHVATNPTQPTTAPVTTHLPSVGTAPQPSTPVQQPTTTLHDIAYVTAPAGANVRTRPVDGAILIAVPFGEKVAITGYDKATQWFQIRYNGVTGWTLAALLGESVPQQAQPVETVPQPTAPSNEQGAWERSLRFVLRWEGGWADNPNDPGGATMKGITIGTYTRWRQAHGQSTPTKEQLRNISDAEVAQIYREWYWNESGANALAWPMCLAQFDLAVNGGTGRAKEALAASGGNFLRYMAWRLDWYTRISGWPHFGAAWTKRCADLLREAAK